MDESHAQRQADPFSMANTSPPEDPFADLVDPSFSSAPQRASGAAPVTSADQTVALHSSVGRLSPSRPESFAASTSRSLDLSPAADGSLAARKRKSQESRQKRDQFLSQMSSFLEGIESSTADVTYPGASASLVSTAAGSSAQSTTSSLAAHPSLSGQHPTPSMDRGELGRVKNIAEDPSSSWSSAVSKPAVPPSAASASAFDDWRRASFVASPGLAPDRAGSNLVQEDLSGDPFLAEGLFPRKPKSMADVEGVIGASNNPHPRGSLFDDDEVFGNEESVNSQEAVANRDRGHLTGSGSLEPSPHRVSPSPRPLSVPFMDARGPLVQARPKSKGKTKPSRGLDLEEVRRRTSLLSGQHGGAGVGAGARASLPPPSSAIGPPAPSLAVASRVAGGSSLMSPSSSANYDLGWRRQQQQQASAGSGGPFSDTSSHPLHASTPLDNTFAQESMVGTFDTRGNYFNEDLLRVRAKESKTFASDPLARPAASNGSAAPAGQGAWGGDALMGSAGSFLSTAKNGAKTLLRDAKAGVDAVGQGWQNKRDDDGQTFERKWTESRGLVQPESDREYEVTFGEGRFGFTLFKEENGPRKGKGVVSKVHAGTSAERLGVHLGDVVIGVNMRRYESYDEVMDVLPKLPRPVLIKFIRGQPTQSDGDLGMDAAFARESSSSNNRGGNGNPLEWLAKLNPFDKQRQGEDELRGPRRHSTGARTDGKISPSHEYGITGEVFADGLGGGVFSWSYYGTSDGVEANTRDTYTEHVMRCRWGRTADSMRPWMVARRYREFDALDLDLRDAYPDRRDALPRLPPKEFFKMAPDVVERRTKGLEMYMTTLIRRFPDLLQSPHLDRFLTISERVSGMRNAAAADQTPSALSYQDVSAPEPSSNVFPSSETDGRTREVAGNPALVGTDFILNVMTSEEAYLLYQERHADPVESVDAERLIDEIEGHLANISPTAHILSDARLYGLVERCQRCWPRIKAAAAAAVSRDMTGSGGTVLARMMDCDERMESAFGHLRDLLIKRGYIGGVP